MIRVASPIAYDQDGMSDLAKVADALGDCACKARRIARAMKESGIPCVYCSINAEECLAEIRRNIESLEALVEQEEQKRP